MASPGESSFEGQKDYDQFIHEFYIISDDANANEKWVEQFTSDAIVIMPSRPAKGSADILDLRKSMWEKVVGRKHTIDQSSLHNASSSSADLTINGTVEYTLRDGSTAAHPWTGTGKLVRSGSGKVQMEFYHVKLVTT